MLLEDHIDGSPGNVGQCPFKTPAVGLLVQTIFLVGNSLKKYVLQNVFK